MKTTGHDFAAFLVLFLAASSVIFFVDVAPYQDVPSHLATATVLLNPDRFPEFVANGLFNTNGFVIAGLVFLGPLVGLLPAMKALVLATLAMTAFAWIRFARVFVADVPLWVVSTFLAPMIHHWWTLMGMLNFSLGFAASLVLLSVLEAQRRAATRARALLLTAGLVLLWFVHAIPILIVSLLVFIECLHGGTREKIVHFLRTLFLPCVPVLVLIAWTSLRHAGHAVPHAAELGVGLEPLSYNQNGWALYNLWAHFGFGLTGKGAFTLVPMGILFLAGLFHIREDKPFFGPWQMAALSLLFVFLPYMLPGFGFVNERVIPFLWAGAFVRLPNLLRRLLPATRQALCLTALGASTLASFALSWDLYRAWGDLKDFMAALDVVPLGARLLNLTVDDRVSARNTWSLHHAGGMYTTVKFTSAQEVWANSPSMQLRRRALPDLVHDPMRVHMFLAAHWKREDFCFKYKQDFHTRRTCDLAFDANWKHFWSLAEPAYDYVLVWGEPSDVREKLPPSLKPIFRAGRLDVYAKSSPDGAFDDGIR